VSVVVLRAPLLPLLAVSVVLLPVALVLLKRRLVGT